MTLGNMQPATVVPGAMFDESLIRKMNPNNPSPGEPLNVPLGRSHPGPGEAYKVVTIIGWTAFSSGLVGSLSRPGDPTYWVTDFGIMWKRGASHFSLPPSLGSMERTEIERRLWDMTPEVRAVLDRHFDGAERVAPRVVEDAIQRGLRSRNHGAASVPQHWFEQRPPSDFERSETRSPTSEIAAERRAKSEAAGLTPDALASVSPVCQKTRQMLAESLRGEVPGGLPSTSDETETWYAMVQEQLRAAMDPKVSSVIEERLGMTEDTDGDQHGS